ncbi:hypothetical protein BT102_08635 [Lacticaseibacillus rhamnosus]|nr:hypothetical protein BT102_08635 [Lacticaseibacillus rhamnosus]
MVAMAKVRPSRPRPLTLRFLIGLAHAHFKSGGTFYVKEILDRQCGFCRTACWEFFSWFTGFGS